MGQLVHVDFLVISLSSLESQVINVDTHRDDLFSFQRCDFSGIFFLHTLDKIDAVQLLFNLVVLFLKDLLVEFVVFFIAENDHLFPQFLG